MSLELKIRKKLGAFSLDVEFSADDKEVMALLGASGCGKSMTLRCIAGIETPDEGRIVVNGEVYFDSDKRINLPPGKRRVGLLFQNYALFPNMTVRENILTGLKRERDRGRRTEKLREAISSFHLEELEDHLPHQLSGGQQQRVALARMMVGEPEILMLDEPFSALDAHLRWQLEKELVDRLAGYKKTTIFVSHSRDEIYRIADKVAVYGNGHIDSFDSKAAVFADPKTWQAAALTGCKNLSELSPAGDGLLHARAWNLYLPAPEALEFGADYNSAGLRAHYLKIAEKSDEGAFEYELLGEIPDNFERILLIRKKGSQGGEPIQWMISKELLKTRPLTGYVRIPEEALMWLKKR